MADGGYPANMAMGQESPIADQPESVFVFFKILLWGIIDL
jgi:hypothetical protein